MKRAVSEIGHSADLELFPELLTGLGYTFQERESHHGFEVSSEASFSEELFQPCSADYFTSFMLRSDDTESQWDDLGFNLEADLTVPNPDVRNLEIVPMAYSSFDFALPLSPTDSSDSIIESESLNFQDSNFYHCPMDGCSRRYRHKGDLKTHVQKRHSEHRELADAISKPRSSKAEKIFQCPYEDCKCGYDRHRDLLRHYRLKHYELYEVKLAEKEQRAIDHEARLKVKFDKESNKEEFNSMVSVMTF